MLKLLKHFQGNAEYLRQVTSVEGQTTENEARRLYSLARGVRAGLIIVEIGTYRGESTNAFAFGSDVSPADCFANQGLPRL